MSAPGTDDYVWCTVSGAGVEPAPGGTGIADVIVTNATAADIGLAVAIAIDAVGDFFITGPSIFITNVNVGSAALSVDNGTGFTITYGTGSGGIVRLYSDAVVVGNDIWAIPWQISSGFGVLNTEIGSVRDIIDGVVLNNPTNIPLYSAGVYVATHNKIYCTPWFSKNSILVIDVATETLSELLDPLIPTFPLLGPGYEMYSDIILAANNKAYCIPFSEGFVLVLDMATDPPTISSPVGLQGLGTVASTYMLTDALISPSPVNDIANARKWSSGVLTPDQKIWCLPLVDTRILVIDTVTDTYTFSQANVPPGSDKWLGGSISDSYAVYEDSLLKSTAGHIIHKTYLNNPINGRIVSTVGTADITSFRAGYNISSIDFAITDAYGNQITEFTGDFNMLLRVTHI
jgi:hypothetical protein